MYGGADGKPARGKLESLRGGGDRPGGGKSAGANLIKAELEDAYLNQAN